MHPTTRDILDSTPAVSVVRHLEACADCRRLAQLLGLELGDRDERFSRGDELDAGGMGRILLGRDLHLDREVALKVPGHLAGVPPAVLDTRLRQEGAIIASLQHPGIVAVYDAGETDGRPWFAMPLVRGRTLGQALREGSSREHRFALLPAVQAVCEAVAHAHSRGVVHRDLKPDNVMLGPWGEVQVIDWGLAGKIGESAPPGGSEAGALTRMGVGTRGYAAPEQLAGAPADPRQDVYALGATLREVLGAHAPPSLRSLVARATAEAPEARWPDATPLARELRRFLEGTLLETHRYGWWERLSHLADRNRPLAWALVGMVVAAVTSGAWGLHQIQADRNRAISAERAAQVELARAMGVRASLEARGRSTVDAVLHGVRALGMARALGAPLPAEVRKGLQDALLAPAHTFPLDGHRGRVNAGFFGDGSAAIAGNGRLRIWRPGSRTPDVDVDTGFRRPWSLVVSPGGAHAAITGREDFVVVARPDGQLRRVEVGGSCGLVAWLDDAHMVTADDAGEVVLWTVEGDRLAGFPMPGPATALAGGEGEVWAGDLGGGVWRWRPGAVPSALPGHDAEVSSFVRLASGWASASQDGRILSWSEAGRPIWRGGAISYMRADPDGSTLLLGMPSSGTFLLSPATGQRHKISPEGINPTPVGFVAGGRLAVANDREGKPLLADKRSGGIVARLDHHMGVATVQALRADDLMLSGSREDATLVDITTVTRPWAHEGEILALAEDRGALLVASTDGRVTTTSIHGGTTDPLAEMPAGLASALGCGPELLLGSFDGTVSRLDADGMLRMVAHHAAPVRTLACAGPDTLSGALDGSVWWRSQLLAEGDAVVAVALAPGGERQAALEANGRLRVWEEGKTLRELSVPGALSLALTEAEVAVSTAWQTHRFPLDGPTGQERVEPGRVIGVVAGDFAIDKGDGTVLVWGAPGVPPRTLAGHGRAVTALVSGERLWT
ncbi:serine/threonine-protein kinase, partial [Myxococcota bacterium]|nr:serine/threonine-protein kinase [Myxococcota bacterium]